MPPVDNGIQQAIKEFAKKQEREFVEKRKDIMVGILAAQYDKAVLYTNLILAAGYAGFFAVWSAMRESLSPTESLVAALGVTLSLTIFILWEIGIMIYTAFSLGGYHDLLSESDPARFDELVDKKVNRENRGAVAVRRLWLIALFLTIVPGFLGAFVLISSFVRQLVQTALN